MKIQITAPEVLPVTLIEAKAHLRITTDDDDTLIGTLITSACDQVEQYTNRALITQTWDLKLDEFPDLGRVYPIVVPLPPLGSITSIKYYDTDGVEQTLASDQYVVTQNLNDAYIVPAYAVSWPSTRDIPAAVIIRFVCGYGLAVAVPQSLKQAMLLLIGEMYENREESIIGVSVSKLPMTAERLMYPYRILGATE